MTANHVMAATLLAGAALLGGASAATAAETQHPAKAQQSKLTLSISAGSPTGRAAPKTVELRCNPTGGTHPHGAAACADLANAGGDLNSMSGGSGQSCTLQLQPTKAEAAGSFNGRSIQFSKTFSNPCAMRAETGAVFNF